MKNFFRNKTPRSTAVKIATKMLLYHAVKELHLRPINRLRSVLVQMILMIACNMTTKSNQITWSGRSAFLSKREGIEKDKQIEKPKHVIVAAIREISGPPTSTPLAFVGQRRHPRGNHEQMGPWKIRGALRDRKRSLWRRGTARTAAPQAICEEALPGRHFWAWIHFVPQSKLQVCRHPFFRRKHSCVLTSRISEMKQTQYFFRDALWSETLASTLICTPALAALYLFSTARFHYSVIAV